MAAALQNSRFTEGIKRLFGIKESVGGDLQDNVVSTQDLSDIQAADMYRLRSEHLWTQGVEVTSGVGAGARVQIGFDPITPPTPKGVLSVVEQIRIVSNTAGQVFFQLVPNALNTVAGAAVRYRDSRAGAVAVANQAFGTTALAIDTPALGGPGAQAGTYRVFANVEVVIPLNVILVPNSRFDIFVNVGSTTLNLFALGRERQLDASEAQ